MKENSPILKNLYKLIFYGVIILRLIGWLSIVWTQVFYVIFFTFHPFLRNTGIEEYTKNNSFSIYNLCWISSLKLGVKRFIDYFIYISPALILTYFTVLFKWFKYVYLKEFPTICLCWDEMDVLTKLCGLLQLIFSALRL